MTAPGQERRQKKEKERKQRQKRDSGKKNQRKDRQRKSECGLNKRLPRRTQIGEREEKYRIKYIYIQRDKTKKTIKYTRQQIRRKEGIENDMSETRETGKLNTERPLDRLR